jgi:hypothetical protein
MSVIRPAQSYVSVSEPAESVCFVILVAEAAKKFEGLREMIER